MIKVCYLILAHNNFSHLINLLKALQTDSVAFILHIDKKWDLLQEEIELLYKISNLYVLDERVDVQWGDITIVEAVLKMAYKAINEVKAMQYCLISGADYPTKTAEYICSYLIENNDKNYIIANEMLTDKIDWLEKGRRRLYGYIIPLNNRSNATIIPREFFSIGNIRQFYKILRTNIRKLPIAIKHLVISPDRTIPYNMKMYGGEMWWVINHLSLSRILEWLDGHCDYIEYHKDTQIPDEIFFNTLVANLCGNSTNDILRFINWKEFNQSSPEWLTMEDKNIIKKCIADSNVLFARKIRDEDVVKFIDSNLNQ